MRSSSIIVTAAKDLIDEIENVVTELDKVQAHAQTVRIIRLDNADPQEILPVLQDAFQSTTTSQNRNNSSSTSALVSRIQQQSQTSSSSSSSSRSSGIGGSGGGRTGGGTGGGLP